MQEIESIYPGATIYTTSGIGSWRNYLCYMGNFNVIIYQLDPFRHFGFLPAPKDLKQGDEMESSGLVSICVSNDGRLALITRRGMVAIYQLPNIEQPILTSSLDYRGLNTTVVAERRDTKVFIQCATFHPSRNCLVAYDDVNLSVVLLNFENNKILGIQMQEPVNVFHFFKSDKTEALVLGGLGNGRISCNLAINQLIDTMDISMKQQTIMFSYLNVSYDGELQLVYENGPMARQTVFTTSFQTLTQSEGHTMVSMSEDPLSQRITNQAMVISNEGQILIYNTSTLLQEKNIIKCDMLGSRLVSVVLCGCFVDFHPGLVALGTKAGTIMFVNINALCGGIPNFTADTELNEVIDVATRNFQQGRGFTSDELIVEVPITRGTQVIMLKNLGYVNLLKQQIAVLHGILSDGSYFIYDYTNTQLIYKSQPNHSESIMQVLPHPSYANMVASVSADSTVKVWKESYEGLVVDQQFGQPGSFRTSGSRSGLSGGQIDSLEVVGSLLSAAWDPRPESCLMLVAGFNGKVAIVDVWRQTVFARFQKHNAKVAGAAWTAKPSCMAATASADGTARLYLFDRNIKYYEDARSFRLEDNIVEFAKCEVGVNGVGFSATEPLLALGCADGYIRIYDLTVFTLKTSAEIDAYYARVGSQITGVLAPVQIGKFAVSPNSVFRVTFHSQMKNVIGIACDGGDAKVYRYEWDGGVNFKVQAAAALVGHTGNVRPFFFHPEIPYLCITGAWDGTVRVWNWVLQKQLYVYKLQSDVYGVSVSPRRPFEIIVGSRDLTIRKLWMQDIVQRYLSESVLRGLISSVLNFQQNNQFLEMSNEQLKKQFSMRQKTPWACQQLLNGFVALIHKASYKYMKDEYEAGSKFLVTLAGTLSAHYAADVLQLNEDSILLQLSRIISFFYPEESGAKHLLQTLAFLNAEEYDVFVSDPSKDGEFAIKELDLSDGLSLTGRSLLYAADQLGRHYVSQLVKIKDGEFTVDDAFKAKKYVFYNFQRKMPALKSEAFRYQFSTGVALLAAAGNVKAICAAASYANMDSLLSYCSVIDQTTVQILERGQNQESAATRLRLNQTIPSHILRLAEAVIIFSYSQDVSLLDPVIDDLISHREFALAKMLAHQTRNEQKEQEISFKQALYFLVERKYIRAAIELVSSKQTEQASRVLALSGEALLSSLMSMCAPEDTCCLGLFGLAEMAYRNKVDPDLLLKIGRGSQISSQQVDTFLYPKWFTFDRVIRYFSYLSKYLEVFKAGETEDGNLDARRTLSLQSISAFYDTILAQMKPEILLFSMNQLGGESLSQRFSSANIQLLMLINQYVYGYIKQKNNFVHSVSQLDRYAGDLACLYNLVRHKAIDSEHLVVKEAAFLSNYLSGIQTFNLKLFKTASYCFSQAEKIKVKFEEVGADINVFEIRARKLISVYFGNGSQLTVNKLQQLFDKENLKQDAKVILQQMDLNPCPEEQVNQKIFEAIGNQTLKSVFCPFDNSLQPCLGFAGQ